MKLCQWQDCKELATHHWLVCSKVVCSVHAGYINAEGGLAVKVDLSKIKEQKRTFSTGSQRSTDGDDTRYDLVSEIGLERLARTYAEGSAKYSDHNWRKGQPFSIVLNHVLHHLNKFKQGDESGEDHLAHAAWGLFALMEFHVTHPELNDLYGHRRADTATASRNDDGPDIDNIRFRTASNFESAGVSIRSPSRDSAAAD